MKEMNVFLVDDDKLFIFLTKKTIKATEVITNIKEFGAGLEAISYLKEIAGNAELLPDLILLDLSMPVMDGWEFLEEYMQLQLEKKIKLYIFTSSISPHDVERARSIGVVSDFIVKPLDRDQIFQILK
jgi:CheY-like chemotaxis protein